MTAGREDGAASGLGRLRTSHAEREQAVGMLKAAFVQGRLTKDEFDLRLGQVLASRTYADLDVVTADIPAGVALAQPAAGQADKPGPVLPFKTAVCVGLVGAAPSMASATVVLVQSSAVPAVVGVLFVGLTGVLVALLLAALLMLVSWVARRAQREPGQGPPSGPAGPASKRQAPARQLRQRGTVPGPGLKRPGAACHAPGLARVSAAPQLAGPSPLPFGLCWTAMRHGQVTRCGTRRRRTLLWSSTCCSSVSSWAASSSPGGGPGSSGRTSRR